jgi:hypothetical protein
MTLFGVEPPSETRPSEPTGKRHGITRKPGSVRPSWTSLTTTGRCDPCVIDVANGQRTRINQARWRRVFRDTDWQLCYEHAQPLRDADARTWA